MNVAIVGATGLVGGVMMKVLKERQLPIENFYPVASARSAGKTLRFSGRDYTIMTPKDALSHQIDLALFSAGGSISLDWAPKFADAGAYVVDNSSAWRMSQDHRLIVPEINADILSQEDRIIANPNCSTIQMALALAPLHQAFAIKRLVISTYQSYTGTGMSAVAQYKTEKDGLTHDKDYAPAYPHPIFANCLPHCDIFLDNDYTKEEMKLVHETRKILNAPDIQITATAVRVPVYGGHSESVNIEFENHFELKKVIALLDEMPGVCVMNDHKSNSYPTPLFAHDKDDVFVGRIRRDNSIPIGLNLWIVSDNLRKGAATNAVQIAEHLHRQNWI